MGLYARAMSTTKYKTTRGGQKDVAFADAVLQGLGEDGGLFVPQELPKISAEELESWRSATYEDVAYGLMSKYITEEVMPAATLKEIVVLREPPTVHVYDVVESGRRHYRSIAFSSDAAHCLASLSPRRQEQRATQHVQRVMGCATGGVLLHGGDVCYLRV